MTDNLAALYTALVALWVFISSIVYNVNYASPDHMITAVELPNAGEPQKASASQEPTFVPSELTVEPKQEQTSEAFTRETDSSIYVERESFNSPDEVEPKQINENANEDENRVQPPSEAPQIELETKEEAVEPIEQEAQESIEKSEQNYKEDVKETNEDDKEKEKDVVDVPEEVPLKPDDNDVKEVQPEENATENAPLASDSKDNSEEPKINDTAESETPERLNVGIFRDVEAQKFYLASVSILIAAVGSIFIGIISSIFSWFSRKEPDPDEPKEYIEVPEGLAIDDISWGSITISWTPVVLADFYQISVNDEQFYASEASTFKIGGLFPSTVHSIRVRTILDDGFSKWSDVLKAETEEEPDFRSCVWKEMPAELSPDRAYCVEANNFPMVTKVNGDGWTSVIGSAPIPFDSVTSWSVNINRNKYPNSNVLIGVAPSDVDVTSEFPCELGWYFNALDSTLCSGPPHNYSFVPYYERNQKHRIDQVGITMDTIKGNLSFNVGYVNHGVAYEGIPLDKPLVPSVVLYYDGDSVGFSPFELVEKEIYACPGVIHPRVMNVEWNSITVAWDKRYSQDPCQVEINGTVFPASLDGSRVIEGLSPSTSYKIRVRAKRDTDIGEWSDYLDVTTADYSPLGFSWEECPEYVRTKRRYSLDPMNSNIAMCKDYEFLHPLIGNTAIPLNTVTSWRVRILNSKNNDGDRICVGVVPQSIDLNSNEQIGWYLNCFESVLCSGPPQNFICEEYGPSNDDGDGSYVHTGSTIDVKVDTMNGEISFNINKQGYEIAYDKIPLDEPLVASVILDYEGDSVELTLLDSKQEYEEHGDTDSDSSGETPIDCSDDDFNFQMENIIF